MVSAWMKKKKKIEFTEERKRGFEIDSD